MRLSPNDKMGIVVDAHKTLSIKIEALQSMPLKFSRSPLHTAYIGLLTTFIAVGSVAVLPNDCPALVTEDQQAAEEKFIDGLLDRRLFPLAVLACEERLAVNTLDPISRVNTVVDLSRAYTAWARQCSPQSSVAHWKQAENVLERWLEDNPENVLDPMVWRQRAHVALLRGKFIRQLSAGVLDPKPKRKESIRYLQHAQKTAEKTLKKINKALHSSVENRLPNSALLRLQTAAEKDLSQSWMEQARCYQAGSSDRIHALQQAKEILSPLAAKNDPIDWDSRVSRLACLRLLGGKKDQNLFQQLKDSYLSENLPVDVRGQICLELARQFSASGRYLDALKALNQPVNYSPEVEAEVDFCELQVMLQAASNEKIENTKNWNARAESQLELIENLHDPYWLQRARALFGRQMTIDPSQHGYALLERAAEGLYQAGQFTESARIYDEAARKADNQKDLAKAFELYLKSAMIQYEIQNYRAASKKLRRIAITYPQESGAAEAHLMAAYNIAQALKGSPPEAFSPYQELLRDHLRRWPTDNSSNRARLWLGRMLAAEKKWSSASEILFEIDPSSMVYSEAIRIAGTCCLRNCADLAEKNDPQLSKRSTALTQSMRDAAERLINAGSPMAASVVADTAALQMHYSPIPYRGVLELIKQGLGSIAQDDRKNHARLHALQVECLVGLGRFGQALDVLKAFTGDTQDIINLILNIHKIKVRNGNQNDPNQTFDTRAKINMACFQILGDFSAYPEKKQLTLIQAETLALLGKTKEALTLLRKLAAEYSGDGKIQSRYADLLLEQSDATSRREALSKYREITRRSRPQTEQWFAAKYGEAKARMLLGNVRMAAQTIRTTQVLYPELGGDLWRERFETLLATCTETEAERQ